MIVHRMDTNRQLVRDLAGPTRSLHDAIPDIWAAFTDLHRTAVSDGVVPARIKELTALAIAVVKHCDGCIAYHAKAAVRARATEAEVAEMLGVALLMDGGTASVYGPPAWEAYHEFAATPQPTPPEDPALSPGPTTGSRSGS